MGRKYKYSRRYSIWIMYPVAVTIAESDGEGVLAPCKACSANTRKFPLQSTSYFQRSKVRAFSRQLCMTPCIFNEVKNRKILCWFLQLRPRMVRQASLTCCLFFFHDFRILCINCDLKYGISSAAPESWPDQECFCGLTLPGFFIVPIALIFLSLPSLLHPLYLKSMSPPSSVYSEPINVRLC